MAKVLIADDEHAILETFCEVVGGLGHTVIQANDGAEALAVARREKPDLVVLDHMMPLMTGVEVIRAMRQIDGLRETPAVLVSAIQPKGREEAWRYVSKPVDLERFERAVQEGVAHGQAVRVSVPEDGRDEVVLAREDMLNWIAHEIRSPLAAATLNAELAQREVANERQRRKLQGVTRNLRRIDELVASVLDAARLQDGKVALKLERLDANELLRTLVADWRDAQPDRVLALEVPSSPVHVLVDRLRLRQVVENLVSNAVKYAPDAKQPIELSLTSNAQSVRISVTDHGPGIAPEQQAAIFNRFHRVEGAPGRGHGLGLYIAATLAKLHGGQLEVKSDVGAGATFTLTLPASLTSVDALLAMPA